MSSTHWKVPILSVITLAATIAVVALTSLASAQLNLDDEPGVFPPLTGPYPVGRVEYDWVDLSRQEIFVNDPHVRREIVVTVYYPAHPAAGARPAPLAQKKTLDAFATANGIPTSIIKKLLRPHADLAAPLATDGKRYPLLLFSPGWGTDPLFYVPTLEDIASHGFVVAAVWHPYSCDVTVFADGRVALANKAGSDPDHYPDEATQQTAIRERVGGVWMADAQFALDRFAQLNQTDPRFQRRLDLAHVGMFGHSFGGTISLALGASDPRFAAVADVDGGLAFDKPDGRGLSKPVLLMRSDDPPITDAELAQAGITRQQYAQVLANASAQFAIYFKHSHPAYLFRLKGSGHLTYASTAAVVARSLPEALPAEVIGTIDGRHAALVYDTYLEAFFSAYLMHTREPLLAGVSAAYPEVTFEAQL